MQTHQTISAPMKKAVLHRVVKISNLNAIANQPFAIHHINPFPKTLAMPLTMLVDLGFLNVMVSSKLPACHHGRPDSKHPTLLTNRVALSVIKGTTKGISLALLGVQGRIQAKTKISQSSSRTIRRRNIKERIF